MQYMFKHPELQDRLLVALNFDMTGANPKTTDAYLRDEDDARLEAELPERPGGEPAALRRSGRHPSRRRAPTPPSTTASSPVAAITSGSDHSVFNNGGIPAMQFNYWGDNFYHSSGDRIEHADPTEMKRVAFMAASAMYYLSAAGPVEARHLAWEAAANGQAWMAEVARQAAA